MEEVGPEVKGNFEHYKFIAEQGQQPLRVDKFLMNFVMNVTRSKVQQAIKSGNVLVNNEVVKANYKVRPTDVVKVVFEFAPRETEILAEDIPLDIVYEDDQVIVVNKPAGLVVHPGHGNYDGTMVNALMHHFENLPENADGRPGLVHRIDKDTTGLLVVAKTEHALTHLSKQFHDKTSERLYHALVWGNVKEDEGTIEGHIGRNLKNRLRQDVYPEGNEGKPAITHFKVLERFMYVTLVECRLETGRTHQIRAHFKHIGHTLFNDERYGGDKVLKGTTYTKYKQFVENCFRLIPRQALHAKTLGFEHPTTGEMMRFNSEIPEDLTNVLEKWRGYTLTNS